MPMRLRGIISQLFERVFLRVQCSLSTYVALPRSSLVLTSCCGCPGPLPMRLRGIHSQLCERVFLRVQCSVST